MPTNWVIPKALCHISRIPKTRVMNITIIIKHLCLSKTCNVFDCPIAMASRKKKAFLTLHHFFNGLYRNWLPLKDYDMSFTNMTDNILSNKSLKLIATDKPLTTTDKIVQSSKQFKPKKNQTGFNFKLVCMIRWIWWVAFLTCWGFKKMQLEVTVIIKWVIFCKLKCDRLL